MQVSRPGRVRKLEIKINGEVEEYNVGKGDVLSINGTNTGSFLIELSDRFYEIRTPEFVVTLDKEILERKEGNQ